MFVQARAILVKAEEGMDVQKGFRWVKKALTRDAKTEIIRCGAEINSKSCYQE